LLLLLFSVPCTFIKLTADLADILPAELYLRTSLNSHPQATTLSVIGICLNH
jgi:hypothetical protein